MRRRARTEHSRRAAGMSSRKHLQNRLHAGHRCVRVRTGKGNKERQTYVSGMGLRGRRCMAPCAGERDPTFITPIHRTGLVQLCALREQSVYDTLCAAVRRPACPPPRPSPHLRRRPAGRRRRHQHGPEADGPLQRHHRPALRQPRGRDQAARGGPAAHPLLRDVAPHRIARPGAAYLCPAHR